MVDWTWAGYLFAAVSMVGAVIYGSFFSEAGKDLYAWLWRKIRPPEPEPVLVRRNFQPKNHSPEAFLWVKELDVPVKLSEGFSYYRDPEDGAKRFHLTDPVTLPTSKAFYMWRPVENEKENAV